MHIMSMVKVKEISKGPENASITNQLGQQKHHKFGLRKTKRIQRLNILGPTFIASGIKLFLYQR